MRALFAACLLVAGNLWASPAAGAAMITLTASHGDTVLVYRLHMTADVDVVTLPNAISMRFSRMELELTHDGTTRTYASPPGYGITGHYYLSPLTPMGDPATIESSIVIAFPDPQDFPTDMIVESAIIMNSTAPLVPRPDPSLDFDLTTSNETQILLEFYLIVNGQVDFSLLRWADRLQVESSLIPAPAPAALALFAPALLALVGVARRAPAAST
jgi:hypothetical protein